MSLRKTAGVALAAIALGATFMAAPSDAATNSSWNGPAPAVKGARTGGTLTVLNLGDFEHIDPVRNYVGGTLDFYRLFTRTLIQYRTVNGKIDLVPDLAADLGTTKDNGNTWVFKLRQGLKYEDGSTVKCADLKYSVQRSFASDVLDGGPTYAAEWLQTSPAYKGPYEDPNGDLTSVVCSPKGDTITFKLNRPIPDLPYVATFGAWAALPKAKDTKQNYDLKPLSNGPYKVQSYDRGKQMTLVRNKFWDPKTDPLRHAYPDKIVVKFGFDQNALEQMFLSDSMQARTAVSLDGQIVTNIAAVANNPLLKSRFLSFQSPYVRYLAINTDKIKDVNVRKAIQCAVDLKTILNAAGGTLAGVYTHSLIPNILPNAFRKFDLCGRDVTKKPEGQIAAAKAWLAKSPNANLNITLAYRDKGVEPDRAAATQAALEAAGFKVTMKKYPRAGYYGAVAKRGPDQPDVIQTSWAFDWPAGTGIVVPLLDGATMTAEDSFNNYSNQNDPVYQAMFKKAAQLTDLKARDKAYGDIEQKLVQDAAVVVPTYIEKSNFLYGSNVGGVQIDLGYGTLSVLNAYVKK